MKTAPIIITQLWNHDEPSVEMQQVDLQLLTICGVSVLGRWCGQFGEFYVGWAPLLGASRSQVQGYSDHRPDYDPDLCPAPDVQTLLFN